MISIITPVYNQSDLTLEFIKSLIPHFMYSDDELIIVNNGSVDNTSDMVSVSQHIFPNKIVLIQSSENLGFGKANNLGAKIAKNKLLAFISNDVKIMGDCINPVISFLFKDDNVAVGNRIINWPAGWNEFNEVPVLPYIEGYFIATHKNLFDRVGGFDEQFFIDYEDMDLSYKLWLSGVGLAQINLPVMHILGGTASKTLGNTRLQITLESQKKFMDKWNFHKKDMYDSRCY